MTMWSILIPTLASRQDKFISLIGRLQYQCRTWRQLQIEGIAGGAVEVVALYNNGEQPLAALRQRLLDSAVGSDYVSFIDDDDEVDDRYVPDIATILGITRPDVISFPMAYTEAGTPPQEREVDASLRYDGWTTQGDRILCDLTHIQPIRTGLARLGNFSAGWPEDRAWRAAVRPHVHRETYIPRQMYHYRHDWADSVQRQVRILADPPPRPDPFDGRFFRWVSLNPVLP